MFNLNKKIPTQFIRLLFVFLLTLFLCHRAHGTSASLTPVYVNLDGQFITNTVGGQTVWQCKSGYHIIYFAVPGTFTVNPNTPVYVKVTYYDAGVGWIQLQYDAPGNAYKGSETHSRSSRVKTLTFTNSYHQLQTPLLAGNENGSADLRLNLNDSDGTPLSIQSVVIQDTPFTDSQFQTALTKPWLSAYIGETRTDAVDASSVFDKVMCGYQGWFNAPNDLQDEGWIHWCRSGMMVTNNLNTDQWPDMSEYSTSDWFQAADLKTKSGQTAYVFSDASPGAVEVQFQWMRKYNIDGVLLQRFLKPGNLASGGHQEWALANVRQAANAEGRIWVIEYDTSSLNDGNAYTTLTNDWMWLVNTFKIHQDSRYGHQNGKPVVAFFGLGDANRNNITLTTGNKILDWFKNDPTYGGNYIWGAPPTDWLTEWTTFSSLYQRYDAISPWHSSNYPADITKANTWGASYWPCLWPGFSWSNEQQISSNNAAFKDRNGGTFFWNKAYNAVTNASVNSLFIGMFDEYDEGTAIMPMSDDPPKSPVGSWKGAFIDNEGKPSDWWLSLAGEARAEMFRQRTNSLTLPTTLELTNRSNIGPEVDDTLNTTDVTNGLNRVPVTFDGNTSVETKGGKPCRYNTNPSTDHYFYFNVDDNFRYQATGLPDQDITIEVEYYDASGSIPIKLEYDSVSGAYTQHAKVINTQGTGRWRTVRYEIDDAYFGNRQNGGADFRVHVAQSGAKLDISRVWVRKDELKYGVWVVDNIGSVGLSSSGTVDELTDTYTINGAGSDIFGTADSFAFCDQTLSGDGQIIARVNSVENTAPAAKAGVMIRASTNSNSTYVAAVVTPSKGVFYLSRTSTGATTAQITYTNLAAPYWVKIVRSGSVFDSYCSPDGASWTQIGSDTISMPTQVYMGLAVTSKSTNTLNTSVFQHVSVSGDPLFDDGL